MPSDLYMCRSVIIAAASMLLMAGCDTSPTGRTQVMLVPDEVVNEMGSEAFAEMRSQLPVSDDTAQADRVACIAGALVDVLDDEHGPPDAWEVVLFAPDEVNAFALPGGYIGVYAGMLDVADNQHQLATVIGHEIGHVAARHGQERVSRHQAAGFALEALTEVSVGERTAALLGLGAQVGVMLPFDRAQESEADRLGLEYMAGAGFDPREAVQLWRNMDDARGAAPPEFLSTHPGTDTRIDDIEDWLPDVMPLFEAARADGRRPDCD